MVTTVTVHNQTLDMFRAAMLGTINYIRPHEMHDADGCWTEESGRKTIRLFGNFVNARDHHLVDDVLNAQIARACTDVRGVLEDLSLLDNVPHSFGDEYHNEICGLITNIMKLDHDFLAVSIAGSGVFITPMDDAGVPVDFNTWTFHAGQTPQFLRTYAELNGRHIITREQLLDLL